MTADDPATRRISTRDLLYVTAGCGVVFAICRQLGPELSLSLFLILFAFGPALMLLVLSSTRQFDRLHRYGFALLTLSVVTAVTMLLCGWSWGSHTVPWLLVGAVIEWPGQAAVLVCLKLIAGQPTS